MQGGEAFGWQRIALELVDLVAFMGRAEGAFADISGGTW